MNIHEISDLSRQLCEDTQEFDNMCVSMEEDEDCDYDEEELFEQFYAIEYRFKKLKKAMK